MKHNRGYIGGCHVQGKLLHTVTSDGQDNTMAKKPVEKPRSATPVIAVRVSEVLHLRIQAAASKAGRSMSEQMAWLLENAFEWQRALGDRDAMLEQARRLLHDANEHAKRIPKDALELEMRRQNWRRTERGWIPPEVHGLPPNGFIAAAEAAAEIATAKAAPAKKRKTK
jgi:hypothetical protein